MTTTHTPGPWSWGNVDWQGWGGDADALDGPDDNVLYGVWHNDSTAGIGITSKANARLIAAAPDLLAVLVEYMAGLDERLATLHEIAPDYDPADRPIAAWERRANAAIAKARGA